MHSTDRPVFVRSGQGRTFEQFPGVTLTTAAGDRLMVSVVRFEPGGTVPVHSHPHEQCGYLISGTLRFTIGEVTELLHPGDQWLIPGGVDHSVVAVDGPAVALDVFTPVREDYL